MDVLMPQLGETVTEGKISTWYKSIGDAVKPGDNLFEIETDKVSMEVPSTTAGVITEIRVGKGEVAPVGTIVAVIADGSGASASAPAKAEAKAAASVSPLVPAQAGTQNPASPDPRLRGDERSSGGTAATFTPTKPSAPLDPFREVRTPERNYGPARVGGITVTPLARRLAAENGIDLTRLKGSGPHGRIIADDVKGAAPQARGGAQIAAGPGLAEIKALYAGADYTEIPLDAMRRTIASRLTQSKQTVPHFYLTADVALDRLLALRAEVNAAAAEGAYKLSVNDFVIKALALALRRVPAANAVWAEDRILRFTHSDIGVAVALDEGLLTPVLRNADTKSLSALSVEMRDLAGRAREKKLTPAEYQGGASAVSNLGMYGVREFSAVINPPQSTILAVGEARRAPVEAPDGSVKFQSQMSVTLSCDHRVVDGAVGAELLKAIRGYLESPLTMLV
jgi:pyruvate dehydrogenase E2 component (dihydrolipoamide acetyltransferase)